MSDLPDLGPYTSALIGAWWPAAPEQPAAAVAHWSAHSTTKQQEAQEFDGLIAVLGARNSGHTADDTLTRLRLGKKRLLDIALQCRAKSEANAGVADAVNHLRDRLKAIADDGNRRIDEILNGRGPVEAKLPQVSAIIAQANSDAAGAETTTLNAIADATQKVFDHTGDDARARDWLHSHAASVAAPIARRPGGDTGEMPMPQSLPGGGLSQAFASAPPGGPSDPGGPTPPPTKDDIDSSEPGRPETEQIPPSPSPSSTPMAGGSLGSLGRLAGPGQAVPTGAATAAAPVSAPAGLLPGYGADMRPPNAAASVVPAGAGSPSLAAPPSGGTAVASARGGFVPGMHTARRPARGNDLQRTLEAVARQAPSLAWAAGLRDDETTTVLVTDLAGGWIPPGVRLPPGVTLLEPAQGRRDQTVVDLLGPVTAAALHQPNGYLAAAGPDDPVPGGGERARHGQRIDELGPTLIDAAGAAAHLPRIVQTVARALARRSGVAGNEIELFRVALADTVTRVLSDYPHHAPPDVADWMLVAAIDALIEGSAELAYYHLTWRQAASAADHIGVAERHVDVAHCR